MQQSNNAILDGVKDGAIIGLVLVLLWYAYGVFVYKYDTDRVKNKVIAKWLLSNSKLIDSDKEHVTADNVQLTDNDVKARILVKNKITQELLRTYNASYTLNCINAWDTNCVAL